MRPIHSCLILTLLCGALLSACDDSPTSPGDGAAAPARVVLVGPPIDLASNGTASYRALALEEDGTATDVTERAVWSSDDEAVFTVEKGLVTIHTAGSDMLRARVGGVEGKLRVSYRTRISGTPLPLIEGDEHLPTLGQSTQLTASMSFPGLSYQDISDDVLWESSDPTVLNVDIHGVATAVGNGEAYVTARYGTIPGSLPILSGPIPAKDYDVTVVAIRLSADAACEDSDEGDAEFSYDFEVTTSNGDRYQLAATDDYPSASDFDLMADEDDAGGVMTIVGEVSFVVSEVQSFQLTANVTEWDHMFYYFGDWIPDPGCDDLDAQTIHRGGSAFDAGLHELRLGSHGSGCDMGFEYRIVVVER